jgi:hypothetical protein
MRHLPGDLEDDAYFGEFGIEKIGNRITVPNSAFTLIEWEGAYVVGGSDA